MSAPVETTTAAPVAVAETTPTPVVAQTEAATAEPAAVAEEAKVRRKRCC